MTYDSMLGIPMLCIAAVVLSGCAQMPSPGEPAANPVSAEPVLCINKDQCDVYWQRAQAWVANNSAYRLQTVTDTIIETYGPVAAQTGLAFRITKVPDDKEGARIYALPVCSNVFGCTPTPADAVVSFKRFVRN
jgi:hypothetical protein